MKNARGQEVISNACLAGSRSECQSVQVTTDPTDEERCEAVRAAVRDPTEPCKGPFYFKRDAQTSRP